MTIKKAIKQTFPFLVPVVRGVRRLMRHVYNSMIVPIRVFVNLPDKRPHKLIRFTIHLADHCNLNCVGCDHFSPVAEPAFVDVDEFKRDFTRMGELFAHKCERISLIGGEPLLNPNINELIKIARENFIEGNIQIITNGILLPKMNDSFWQACHDNNIRIKMTHYPIKVDIGKIKALSEKFGVNFICGEADKTMRKEPLDLSGNGNAVHNFAYCTRSNGCITLEHGKLFTCTMIPNVRFFNKAFKQHIPVTEADYIDIYSNITPDEILRKLATHTSVCSYCGIDKEIKNIKWHVSKREMSEWV